ncbi:MAG: hypothetical protein CBB68_02705 [Rhodospirillaceae bacterium TMED8]|nr:hypothetical protein [Magnetovibrio sp.]OUT52285.1 MAG: hypothetical protein CBB68_02705 [Rhodospirillaceae bacterium TMED8]
MIAAIEEITGVKWRAQGPAFLIAMGHGATHWILATVYVVLPFIRDDLGLSYTEAGSVITILHASSLSANIGSGAVVDITGKRVLTQVSSLLIGALALTLVGLAETIWLLGAMLVLIGLTNNLWHPAAIAFLSRTYPENRGYALSIHTLGASFGDTLAPLSAGSLLAWFSWQGAASINALPVFAVALVLTVMLGRHERRENVRLSDSHSRRMSFADYLSGLGGLFKDRMMIGLCIMAGFRSMCQNGLLLYIPMLLKNNFEFGPILLGVAITAMQVGGIMGGPIAGTLSDRLGRRSVVLGGLAITSLLVVGITEIDGAAILIVVLALLGCSLFAVRPVIHSWAMDLTPGAMQGSAVSLLFGTQSLFSMVVPIGGGVIADQWGVPFVFFGLAAAMFIATVFTFKLPDNRQDVLDS